jgi:PAS domain S-box-containing protein
MVMDHEDAIRLSLYTGRHQITEELIESYRTLLEAPAPWEIICFCDFNSGVKNWRQRDLEKAAAFYSKAEKAAEEHGCSYTTARCRLAMGVMEWTRGDYNSALPLLLQAEKELRQRRDVVLASCLNWLGIIYDSRCEYSKSWKAYTEALEISREGVHISNHGYLLCNFGLLCQRMGLYDQAEDYFRQSMEIQKDEGNRYGYADSMANLGMLMAKHLGKPGGALPVLEEAALLQIENNEPGKAGLILTNAGLAAFRAGDEAWSASLFDRAEELVFSGGLWDDKLEFCRMKAEVCTESGKLETAQELFEKGEEIRRTNMPDSEYEDCFRAIAGLHLKRGDYEKACTLLLKSISARDTVEKARTRALQNVLKIMEDSASKDRELQQARLEAGILEERNRALSASEERFRRLVHSMAGIGVIAVDSQHRIVFWNRTCEELYGFLGTEAHSRKVRDLLVPGQMHDWFDSFLSGEGSLRPVRVDLISSDGSRRNVLLSRISLSPDETFLIQVDLSDQRRAEEQKSIIEGQMRSAQKLEALGTLAGGIAHDFNNLLQGILGNAVMLCETLEKGTEQFQSAERVRSAAERSSRLCLQMLDYAGANPLSYVVLDLNDLIRCTSAFLEAAFPENARLALRLSPDLDHTVGDETQLRQVIVNLAMNGADALTRPGEVCIATCGEYRTPEDFKDNILETHPAAGEYICVSVSDNGEGIEREALPRVFDPFYSTRRTGRGLGLSAVLGIIRGHKGVITVNSTPGIGSEFRVYLPAAIDSGAVPAQFGGNESLAIAGKTVLVVDDEQVVRETICAILTASGSCPVSAEGGAEALDYLDENTPDLMVLDLTMPGMTGAEVFNTMVKRGISIPVLIISGYSGENVETVFEERKPGGFLRKPFTPAELRLSLGKLLESSV